MYFPKSVKNMSVAGSLHGCGIFPLTSTDPNLLNNLMEWSLSFRFYVLFSKIVETADSKFNKSAFKSNQFSPKSKNYFPKN